MVLLGRENTRKIDRIERFRCWAAQRSPYALISPLFGAMAVVDSVTMVIGAVFGAAAVVLGVIGLRDIKSRPSRSGRRLCFAGIGLGAAAVSLSTVVWYFLGH